MGSFVWGWAVPRPAIATLAVASTAHAMRIHRFIG